MSTADERDSDRDQKPTGHRGGQAAVAWGVMPQGEVAYDERPHPRGCRLDIEQSYPRRRLRSVARANAARLAVLAALLFGLSLAVAGCGGSSGSSGGSNGDNAGAAAAQAAAASESSLRASIAVGSPAIRPSGTILPHYTCKGANESLPLKWAGVAPSAKELVVLVRSLVSLGHTTNNWAVAGINPALQELKAGQVPAGAVVGRNSFGQTGYNLCLLKGASHMLVTVDVMALPHAVALKPGFDPDAMVEQVRNPGVGWGSIVGYLGTRGE